MPRQVNLFANIRLSSGAHAYMRLDENLLMQIYRSLVDAYIRLYRFNAANVRLNDCRP